MKRDVLLSELSALSRDLALAGALDGNHAWRSAANALTRVERALARPLRLAVFGEEKTGKSSLINFLLKRQVVPSGGLPGQGTCLLVHYAAEPAMYAVAPDGGKTRLTTKAVSRIAAAVEPEAPKTLSNVIYDATNPSRPPSHASAVAAHLMSGARAGQSDAGRLIELGLPQPSLRELEMMEAREYPKDRGAAPIARAFRFIDIAVWCTLSTQAWKESERAAWRAIPAGQRRRAVMAVTYKDAIRNARDEEKILTRLRNDTRSPFNEVVLVSLRDAAAAEASGASIEQAIAELAEDWRRHRQRKAARLLGLIARLLVKTQKRGSEAAGQTFPKRLDRIMAAYGAQG